MNHFGAWDTLKFGVESIHDNSRCDNIDVCCIVKEISTMNIYFAIPVAIYRVAVYEAFRERTRARILETD